MRKADLMRGYFSVMYTLYDETPEEDRDEALGSYLKKYTPNFTKREAPEDDSEVRKIEAFVNKHVKDAEIPAEDGFEVMKKYVRANTDFADFFSNITLDDWNSLCQLIDVANEIDAVNRMKETGEYQELVKSGNADKIGDYIKEHPDLMDNADPKIAAQAMMTGVSNMPLMGSAASVAAEPAKKKTVHPSMKKQKNRKKKKK